MADLVANWSPEELEGARLGAAKKLKTGNIPWTPEQRPETIARLRPLFPNDEARLQKFVDAIDAKRRISETNTRVNAGSQTGLNRVEDDDAKNVSTAIRGAEAVASKNLLRIGRFVHDTYTDWRNKSDPEVLNEIAKALGSPLRYGSPGMNMLEKFANAAPSTRRHMLPLTNSFSAFSPAVPFPGEGDRR